MSAREETGRQAVATDQAPAAIGPYSQAIRSGSLLFVSGQIALDPLTGQLVSGDVAAETRQVLANLGAILTAAGTSFAQVVKTTVYLVDMADFQAMNDVYARAFPAPAPARATVAVAALPRGARVEIEIIADS
jgi:2-iminobutanoate/2-iminopropanoate deaminase